MDMGKKPLGNEVRAPKTDETVPVASEAPVQPMAVKEKKHYQSKRFVLWRTVVILLLIFATALVVAGWFYTQDLYSQLNKKEAEIAELQSVDKTDMSTDDDETLLEEDSSVTTQTLADDMVAAYKKSIVNKDFSVQLTKVSGEYALVGVYRANSDSTETFVYKNVNNQLMVLGSYDMDGWTESEASYYKSIYGVDAKALGIPVGPPSTM